MADKAKAPKDEPKEKRAGQAARSKLDSFVAFIRERGIVGLAIGLAIGTATSAAVAQIVSAVVTPTIVLLLGANGLDSLSVTVSFWGRSAQYNFGGLIDALLTLIAVAALIYFVVMGLRLDRLDNKKEE